MSTQTRLPEKFKVLPEDARLLPITSKLQCVLYFPYHATYRKNSKIWDASNNCHNCPKNSQVRCNTALMHPKDADGMANSVDPDQTASSEVV